MEIIKELLFGNYKGEPITWIVLEDLADSKLLISKYCLDARAFNDENVPIKWEDCTLRKWLNNDFYKDAFSETEQNQILEVKNENECNERFNSESSNETSSVTYDKIYLLSIREAGRYFTSMQSRMSSPTEYAKQKGIFMSWNHCWWWLRTNGNYPNIAAEVYYDGYVDYLGHMVDFCNDGVRPVIRIKNK